MAFEGMNDEAPDRRTRVEARCVWCGPVGFDVSGLRVHVGAGQKGLIEYRCPVCARLNVRGIGERDVRTLLTAGVDRALGPAPFELLEEHSGPPIGWDDLLDFHEALTAADSRWGRWLPGDRAARDRAEERDAA
jgi:hypothetical protein